MSVTKLLSRIVAPDDVLMKDVDDDKEDHEIVSWFFCRHALSAAQ